MIVVMGVCGSGKISVGRLIAERMDWTFVEGDDLHPETNLRKMAAGTPLTDEDRRPWLDRIAGEMRRAGREGRSMVVACSALRRIYRDRLRACGADVRFVHLIGAPALLRARMARREGHFAPRPARQPARHPGACGSRRGDSRPPDRRGRGGPRLYRNPVAGRAMTEG